MKWYIYSWQRYLGMPVCGGTRKGMRCRVLIHGGRNSALLEFEDGYRAVSSRSALRRIR